MTTEFDVGTKEFKPRTRRFQGGTQDFRLEPGSWNPGFPILWNGPEMDLDWTGSGPELDNNLLFTYY